MFAQIKAIRSSSIQAHVHSSTGCSANSLILSGEGTFSEIFCSNFGVEKYLSLIRNFKYRQASIKTLRISAHRLPVETDRHNNVSYRVLM